nr:YoaK family protein [uncultured Flavobacterium sp.]
MFRHKGKRRTFNHNLKLATLLSYVAGLVNVTGLLSIHTLTTNVTGHFAYFAEDLVKKNYVNAYVYLIFILSFLLGSFTSNLLIEIFSRIRPKISYAIPITLEILILISISFWGNSSILIDFRTQVIGCSLLFAMGMQNSLVTKVSQSIVRTTHLTGLFTDLGIELSQLFFYRKSLEFKKLTRSIFLRLMIIIFFFLGCITGGFIFISYELKTLLIASCFLVIALFYDSILYQYYNIKRKMQIR